MSREGTPAEETHIAERLFAGMMEVKLAGARMILLSFTRMVLAQDAVPSEPAPVWLSEHTYYFDTVGIDEVPADVTMGGITWIYAGQQVFHALGPNCDSLDAVEGAMDVEGSSVWFGAESVASSPTRGSSFEEQLWNTVRVDDLGRRWVVANVDIFGLQEKSDEYAAAVAEHYQTDWSSWDVAADLAREFSAGVEEEGVDFTWYDNDCDGIWNSTGEVTYWEDDDRDNLLASEWSTASEAALASVPIYYNFGTFENPSWGPRCSGAFVDYNSILTAAHCLWDDGYAQPASEFRVCTEGNYGAGATCRAVSSRAVNPSYSGGSVFANDYAVLSLSSTYGSFMALSTHTSAELWALDIRHYGSPIWNDADQDPCLDGWQTGINQIGGEDVLALTSVFDMGPPQEVTSEVLGAGIDAGEGQSGGAFYVWEGSVPTHVAVLKGWHVLPAYNGGPRTSNIRTWVLANI